MKLAPGSSQEATFLKETIEGFKIKSASGARKAASTELRSSETALPNGDHSGGETAAAVSLLSAQAPSHPGDLGPRASDRVTPSGSGLPLTFAGTFPSKSDRASEASELARPSQETDGSSGQADTVAGVSFLLNTCTSTASCVVHVLCTRPHPRLHGNRSISL